jgi:hypothetical protein
MAYFRQRFRTVSLIKIVVLFFIFFIIIFHFQLNNKSNQWCDPEKPLWWFCPWPGPETVCSWNEHFPKLNENIR